MCKAPRSGSSKTRLSAALGADAAAALSRAFLEDCAGAGLAAARQSQAVAMAFYRPADAQEEIMALLGSGWTCAFCDHGDLGATMLAALGALLAKAADGAIIMGADIPLITPADILSAARALRAGGARRVVIIPSVDGGYCLIGIRSIAAAAPLFEPMAWSTPQVLRETLRRARQAKLDVTVLPPQRDIDDLADLDWLQAELRRQADEARQTGATALGAAATRAALARLKLR
jgi:uncharacterized protein